MSKYPVLVATCTIYYKDRFLVIRRHKDEKKYADLWGFPGGKAKTDETLIGTLIREVIEETQLKLEDEFLIVNSYYYGNSIGVHFAVKATSDKVVCEDGVDHKWLSGLKELQDLNRIPGIDYHFTQADKLRKQKSPFLSLKETNYTHDKYVNQ